VIGMEHQKQVQGFDHVGGALYRRGVGREKHHMEEITAVIEGRAGYSKGIPMDFCN
jgi:hypothetical protein